jgi:hypothetical protein
MLRCSREQVILFFFYLPLDWIPAPDRGPGQALRSLRSRPAGMPR